jgi:hypothetical protein
LGLGKVGMWMIEMLVGVGMRMGNRELPKGKAA